MAHHITHIPESYILQTWRLNARYKNVAIENGIRPFPNQGTRGAARLWTLCSKFNAIVEIVADSDIHISKLDAFLKRFATEISNEYKSRSVYSQTSQFETNIGSSRSVVVLRYGEELTIRDPTDPVPTKGPKGASRLKSSFKDSLSQKKSSIKSVKTVNSWAITGLVVHYWYEIKHVNNLI